MTRLHGTPYNAALMSADLPETVDAWRAVAARRIFEGEAPLSAFKRLADSLTDTQGHCSFRLSFDRDAFGVAVVEIDASAALPLMCQRSLTRFLFPLQIRQRLGLVRSEKEESALPPEVEPVLVGSDGEVRLLELVEDELILALPVVPLGPEELAAAQGTSNGDEPVEEPRKNPFAALAALKQTSK